MLHEKGELSVRLPPILDLAASSELRAALRAAPAGPLSLDAADVERLGGLCAQVLLAAFSDRRGQGHDCEITAPSPAFVESARIMGLEMHLLELRSR